MHLYKDCSDMPIGNFDIVYRTNDLRYMVVGWDLYSEIEIPKKANEQWQKIRNEWVKLLDDNTITYYYQLVLETIYLKTRRQTVELLLDRVRGLFMDEETLDLYKQMLGEWDYSWRKKLTREKNLEVLYTQLKRSENKISLKESELEMLKKDNDYDDVPVTLERQALVIEQATNIKIDIRKDSVLRWIEVCKIHQEITQNKK